MLSIDETFEYILARGSSRLLSFPCNWISAEEPDLFNRHIDGTIKVVAREVARIRSKDPEQVSSQT